MERAMTERFFTIINIWDVKGNVMDSNTRHSAITMEEVYHKFNIGIKKAKETLIVRTHKNIIHEVHTLHRIYRVDNMQLNMKRLNIQFYTYHLLAKTKSLGGSMGACFF